MPHPTHRLVSCIYEGEDQYPVVIHIFQGYSPAEARGLYKAHQETDSFLRGCSEHGRFRNFKCRQELTAEQWNGRNWVCNT